MDTTVMRAIKTFSTLAMLIAGATLLAPPELSAQKKKRDLITQEELQNSGQRDQDAYSAIRSLRPHFMAPPRGVRTMGGSTAAALVVYVDGMKTDLQSLRTTPASEVVEVRYLEPAKAEEEYGITHSGGAILVKTSKARG
jgi:hypothetical protein